MIKTNLTDKSVLDIATIPRNESFNIKSYDNGIHFKSFRNYHLHNVLPMQTPKLNPIKFSHSRFEKELTPSHTFKKLHVEDESLKLRGIDKHKIKHNENPNYYELGLKGMTPAKLMVSRMQEEAGTPTVLGASLSAKENDTSPKEEFWKMYNASKTVEEQKEPDEEIPDIIIEPAVDDFIDDIVRESLKEEEEDEDDEEDEDNDDTTKADETVQNDVSDDEDIKTKNKTKFDNMLQMNNKDFISIYKTNSKFQKDVVSFNKGKLYDKLTVPLLKEIFNRTLGTKPSQVVLKKK